MEIIALHEPGLPKQIRQRLRTDYEGYCCRRDRWRLRQNPLTSGIESTRKSGSCFFNKYVLYIHRELIVSMRRLLRGEWERYGTQINC